MPTLTDSGPEPSRWQRGPSWLREPRSLVRGWLAASLAFLVLGYLATLLVDLSRHQWVIWGPLLLAWWIGRCAYQQANPRPLLLAPFERVSAISGRTMWTTLKVIWAVVVNLISLAVVVAVLQYGVTHAQGLVVAVLALIYLTMIAGPRMG